MENNITLTRLDLEMTEQELLDTTNGVKFEDLPYGNYKVTLATDDGDYSTFLDHYDTESVQLKLNGDKLDFPYRLGDTIATLYGRFRFSKDDSQLPNEYKDQGLYLVTFSSSPLKGTLDIFKALPLESITKIKIDDKFLDIVGYTPTNMYSDPTFITRQGVNDKETFLTSDLQKVEFIGERSYEQ